MENTTAAVTAPKTGNVFDRFIDKIEAVFVTAEPMLQSAESLALEAEPILALTPAGPEYIVAVNAIVGAQQVAQASLAAGVSFTGAQKAALAVQAATPALNAILTSKGVSVGTEATIASWIQSIFNILAGPVALKASTPVQG